ncbi:MAG: response regulator [Ignavibacteriales bacterium]|nr:response regulator [Ignavibacteriales bacterium]
MIQEKKILVVEDDHLLQEFYKILFRKLGYNVFVTEDGDEIIRSVIDGEVSLIIMDINLKNTYFNSQKIDGLSLSKYIKKNFYNLNIPILLITAYTPNFGNAKILEESMADDMMVKPIISFDTLIGKVNRLLCRQQKIEC